MKLNGKVALITGGTAGIGEQIAHGFVREGATVIVASRNRERVANVSRALKELGNAADGMVIDITDRDQVAGMIADVVRRHDKLDIMLNSAGFYPATPVLQIPAPEWEQVVKINLTGPFYCAQLAAEVMVRQKSGRIIFLTSGQALRGVPLMAHYSASKGGLVALARAMASELGIHGITVNTIACGLTTTDMVNSHIPPEFQKMVAEMVPLKRLAAPEEYTDIAVLLASGGGSYITGETIAADGGVVNADAVRM